MLTEVNDRAAVHRAARDRMLHCLQPFSPIVRLIATNGAEDVRPHVNEAVFQGVLHALAEVVLHAMELRECAVKAAELRREAFDGSN